AFIKLEIFKKAYYDAKKEGLFFKMVRGAFSQRRKTIVNALSHIYKKEEVASAIKYLGFNPNVRIENLSLGELMDLFNRISIIST
ncbi:MAG: rRNA adenine N-6-methyltransferase family protein, partial [Candidatus Omnitrophota bacterium]|nr:rRNA adenine N-6-methyltransferase family protein [Candidatus Omnitrophota bacterium]